MLDFFCLKRKWLLLLFNFFFSIAHSTSTSNGIHVFKDNNNVRKLDETKKQNKVGIPVPFNDFEQVKFFCFFIKIINSKML